MNSVHLKSFVAIADNGSFSKAAQALHISAQALFQQIELLEATVGTTLFQRSHQGVRLTDAGNVMYHGAKELLSYSDSLIKKCQECATATSELVVGTSHEISRSFLYQLSCEYKKKYPGKAMNIIYVDPDTRFSELLDAKVDICESFESSTIQQYGLLFAPIIQSQLYCIMSKNHPLVKRERIYRGDLKGHTVLLSKSSTDNFGNTQISFDAEVKCKRYYDSLSKKVEAAFGDAIYFDYLFPESVDTDRLVAVPYEMTEYSFGFVHAPSPSITVMSFIEFAKTCGNRLLVSPHSHSHGL
jgi:DNA-binding transcriptional LysR family regulator